MTTEKDEAVRNSFVTSVLPWLAGAAGLLVYLCTLDHWISLLSLPTVARISGWLWLPDLGKPLTSMVLFPFRWLPETWIPLAMNIFTALGAALALALLARSVALLRYDLTPEDPLRKGKPVSILSTPTAWMPPLVAVIVCGLQLSFWENATSATSEIVNLLVFAYVVRCLLEFRVRRNQSWLSRSAFFYAAGMVNSWVMLAYFPIFFAAIIWVKGIGRFWNRRFLLRTALWGLAGLCFYLVLPAGQSFSSPEHLNFRLVLMAHLKSQWLAVVALGAPDFRVLILTSLLPFLILSIRWKSHTVQFTDDSRAGVFLLKASGHFVHAIFFITSIWIALEPTFTPHSLQLGTPMLIYYYLWALISGYCTGYFLLLGSHRRKRPPTRLPARLTYVLLLVLPLMLVWRNLGQIRLTNGLAVHEFARGLYEDLPDGRSVVLSEDHTQLLLLQAELARHEHDKDALPVDTRSLVLPQYQVFMARRYGARWPEPPPTNTVGMVGPRRLLKLISSFAAQEQVVYLHPSSGLFFEQFMDQPKGSIHFLVPRPTKVGLRQSPSDAVVATNEEIWQRRWTKDMVGLTEKPPEQPKSGGDWESAVFDFLRLNTGQNFTARFLGTAYSKSLNYWGVELQRSGKWREAGVWFQRAIKLNPENFAAHVNAEFNARWQRGNKSRLLVGQIRQEFTKLAAKADNWVAVLNADGPVDEPTFLLWTGRVMLESRNDHQAANAFARSAELSPEWLAPKLWLTESYLALREFTNALELTDHIQTPGLPKNGPALAQLLYCRVLALRRLGRTNEATACIEKFARQHGNYGEVLSMSAMLYAGGRQFEQEIVLLNELLKRRPNNSELLRRKGLAELRSKQYGGANTTLTKALLLNPSDDNARLLRAVARLRAGQLDKARGDYKGLLARREKSQLALFGLGGIAWREHDTNAILHYYREYLSNAVPRSLQYGIATQRLQELSEDPVP